MTYNGDVQNIAIDLGVAYSTLDFDTIQIQGIIRSNPTSTTNVSAYCIDLMCSSGYVRGANLSSSTNAEWYITTGSWSSWGFPIKIIVQFEYCYKS